MFFKSAQVTLCGSQNLSFQNQAKIPAILLCPLLSRLPQPAQLFPVQVAQGCARGWPKPVPPQLPLSPRPQLSKARGEPQFSLPSGRAVQRSRLARHMAAPAALPDWFALASSSKAHAASSPTPGGKGAAAAPRRGALSGESCPALCLRYLTVLWAATWSHPRPPSTPSHMLRMPAPAPLEFQGFQSTSRAPAGSEEASRGRGDLQNHPQHFRENGKKEKWGAQRAREK